MHPSGEDRSFLFLLGSSRLGGNTETLACTAASYLPGSVKQNWIRLSEAGLPPFEDYRHAGLDSWPTPSEPEQRLLDATLEATDIVLATPTYWYTVSASTKLYLDYWSGWMRVPGVDFKKRMAGKTLWTVSVLGEEPEQAAALVDTLQRSARYLSMNWGGALLGNGSKPDDVLRDSAALAGARTFFGG
ncbi:flavodoxin [Lentzea sp. NBRC 105346]|uniref:flavodoxin family protein n=1 Tax=Lentzea sp. NBRC 105346 TaxID=3032205 RepID=UPI0024A2755A|nr:NAD(P)H-dependent oxidoreductase [Lentzea sp. NBRC 105346]GLZ31365.1 flavodoxin [Lentzea sp. NBRC 105346]